MKTIVVIQARMGSTRLHGKILKTLGDTLNLNYVVVRCKQIKGVDNVIVATSNLKQDDEVEKWCEDNNVECFRGSENDVLSRYIEVSKKHQPDYVIRVTADCPFVDYEMASEMLQLIKNHQVDIIDLANAEKLPRGLAAEVIAFKALLYIDMNGKEERHREHVTYFANEFKEQFTRVNYLAKDELLNDKLRITLDTDADYELLKKIADHFNDELISSSSVVNYLNNNPHIAKINAHIEQKPVV